MSKLYVKLILCLLILVASNKLSAQSIDLVLKVADDLYEAKDYYGSIQFYKKALDLDSSNAEVLVKYGTNLMTINNPKKAARYLEKAYLYDRGKTYPSLAYDLAEALRSSGDYRKARRYYNTAITPYRREKDSYWYKRIDISKDAAAWAYKNDDIKIAEPKNIGNKVNTEFSEFGGVFLKDKFYFSAMVADTVTANKLVKDKHYFSRIYSKSLADDEKSKKLSLDAKSTELFKNLHLANPAFYGGDFYFTACDSNFNCKIYSSKLIEQKITKPKELNKNINSPGSNNTQPFVTKIKEDVYLFFVSDRSQGEGGLDIWVAKKEGFGFGKAINLGTVVNSPDDEISPFYDTLSKQLFFSSNWHIGFGGYDIFRSEGVPPALNEPKNLGYGINTEANEYYFSPIKDAATLTSNRKNGNVENSSTCCNDLFEVKYNRVAKEYEDDEKDSEEVKKVIVVNEAVLNKYLPLDLYFHNDEPNPNSRDTSTQTNYLQLAKSYTKMEGEYISKLTSNRSNKDKEETEGQLKVFFEEDVQLGLTELEFFTPLLLKELEKGNKVVLTIKGYASSLSETAYNLNLTLRRIESLINYFESYQAGAIKPYLNGTSSNGGSLQINKVPFGEFAVSSLIDNEDKIEAVYSPAAARERKIELVALSSTSNGMNTEKQAKIEFNSKSYAINVEQRKVVSRVFTVKNSGESDLRLYNVGSNCSCATTDYPSLIKAGEEKKISVEVSTTDLIGEVSIELLVVSNTLNNLNTLKLNLEVVK